MLHIVLKQCDVLNVFNVVQLMLLGRGEVREREPFCDPKFSDLGQRKHHIKEALQGQVFAKHLAPVSAVITTELMGHAMPGISKSFLAVRMKS